MTLSLTCLFDTFVFNSSKENLRNKLYSTTTISLIPRQQRGITRAWPVWPGLGGAYVYIVTNPLVLYF